MLRRLSTNYLLKKESVRKEFFTFFQKDPRRLIFASRGKGLAGKSSKLPIAMPDCWVGFQQFASWD